MIKVRGRKPERDWSLVDWSKSTTELAELYNKRITTISILRRKHAPKTVGLDKNKNKIKYHVEWNDVDWSIKDGPLSEKLGVPVGTVRQKRRKHAKHTIKTRGKYLITKRKKTT